MITHRFDQGWGPQYAIKQFEQQLVDQYMSKCHLDTVLINSTWYSQDYHLQYNYLSSFVVLPHAVR